MRHRHLIVPPVDQGISAQLLVAVQQIVAVAAHPQSVAVALMPLAAAV
jgi:hypothetical protein